MTALVAIGVLSFVWEQHFQSYTRDNQKVVANGVAIQIADRFATNGGFYTDDGSLSEYVVKPAIDKYNDSETKGLGIAVFEKGNPEPLWFSTLADKTENGEDDAKAEGQAQVSDNTPVDAQTGEDDTADPTDGQADHNDQPAQDDSTANGQPEAQAGAQAPNFSQEIFGVPSKGERVDASIKVGDEVVGSVSVWLYGSSTLLTTQDIEFREKSYQAMIFAAAIAIILSLCIGFLFARNLVRPINRMTTTAKAIAEGDMSARTNMRGDDEISRLGETFDAMAESVEKDRELERRLTTDVAHELRTPLMAIQSTVEAMVDGVFVADTERLETVNSEVQRLSRLVDALLKLARLENRSTPMKEEVVDVGSLIAGIVSTHEAFVNDSGLTMEFKTQPDVYVYGDADMIRQATANLISNAVRYTPEGGHVTVSVKKGDIMASIAVKDTGIGLSPEEAKMVFSRFWRADAGRNRESGGLGVGLAVVKEIVDRHGGWVHVEGKPNEGATFTIYIPLYDENRVKNRTKNKEKSKSRSKK
ncbi:sensor histidine kinase [Raoultibacter phocaeensis]|uniref:sensor histidine kinase n=1 Tax=Raoultibacter phocaeensis TaxID=2479841 RepID=UPI00111885DA